MTYEELKRAMHAWMTGMPLEVRYRVEQFLNSRGAMERARRLLQEQYDAFPANERASIQWSVVAAAQADADFEDELLMRSCQASLEVNVMPFPTGAVGYRLDLPHARKLRLTIAGEIL